MIRNRTYKIALFTIGAIVLCLVAVVVCAMVDAGDAYASAIATIALSFAGGGGIIGAVQGARDIKPSLPQPTDRS